MEWIPIVAIITNCAMVVLIVFFVARSRQRRFEVHAQVQQKLIDRFGSAPELIEFLQSPAGREFVTGVQSAPMVLARERIARPLGGQWDWASQCAFFQRASELQATSLAGIRALAHGAMVR